MKYPLYNDDLCPDIWDKKGNKYSMKPDVRETLMKIATDFVDEYLKKEKIKLAIKDVLLVGSSTNYNWTEFSDLDLHVLVDYDELGIGDEYANILLASIKANWNKSHDIIVKKHPVEIYVQGEGEELASESIFSVKNDKWIESPVKENPKFDKEFIKKYHSEFKRQIDYAIKSDDEEELKKILDKIYEFRKKGLASPQGEFSGENIVFKILRVQGYLDKIKDTSTELYDKEMTLKEIVSNLPPMEREQEFQEELFSVAIMFIRYFDKYHSWPKSSSKIIKAFSDEFNMDERLIGKLLLDAIEKLNKASFEEEERPISEYSLNEGVGWGIEPKKQKRRWSVPFNTGDNTEPLEEEKSKKEVDFPPPKEEETEEPKILCKNKWLSLFSKKCPKSQNNEEYVYSHETRCSGSIVAVLLYERVGKDAWKYGLRSEITPCWGSDEQISSLTGGVDDGGPPINYAIKEVKEEAGYICKKEDFTALGTCRGTKSTDTLYTLYALNVSGLKKVEPTGKDVGKIEWMYSNEAIQRCVCPIWFTMYARFGSW